MLISPSSVMCVDKYRSVGLIVSIVTFTLLLLFVPASPMATADERFEHVFVSTIGYSGRFLVKFFLSKNSYKSVH